VSLVPRPPFCAGCILIRLPALCGTTLALAPQLFPPASGMTAHAAKELGRKVRACSVLGDFAAPLAAVRFLVGVEPVARALVTAPEFLPNLKDITGRGIEV
jgi:hypothetical protein